MARQIRLVKPVLNEFGFDYLGGFRFTGAGGRALDPRGILAPGKSGIHI